jgi:hypothetical protein
MKKRSGLCVIALVLVLCAQAISGFSQESASIDLKPRQVVLTYQDDPRTGITITWRTGQMGEKSLALYSPFAESDDQPFQQKEAETFTFKETKAWLHSVRLTDLAPGRLYRVILQTEGQKGEPFNFRTAPAESGTLSFVIGSDAQHLQTQMAVIRQTFSKAASENPDFFVYSGDFVNAELNDFEWDLFFDLADELLITPDGRRIPIIPAIGNHEVVNGYGGNSTTAPFFYRRFALPEPRNYHAVRYGPDLLIISLDSNHSAPVDGGQAAWLKETLEQFKDVKWKIVQYHDGAWWGNESMYVKMRAFWIPLFEKYGVSVVHNGHSHSYKRTAPIAISNYSEEIDRIVEEALARARKDFDPSKKYTPPLQRNLMKLSRGDWKSTGYSSFTDGLKDMVYMLSLYVIQTGEPTKGRVYDQISTTQLYAEYWAQVLSQDNSAALVDPAKGIVYLTGGGLGAQMDATYDKGDRWWIEDARSEYHIRKITLDAAKGDLRIEPMFYDTELKTWQAKDSTVIHR